MTQNTTTELPAAPSKRTFNLAAFVLAVASVIPEADLGVALEAVTPTRSDAEQPVSLSDKLTNYVVKCAIKTQSQAAACVINLTFAQGKTLKASDLTACLAAGFPGAGVGDRHGPHYLSHARKGHLDGVIPGVSIPVARRAARATGGVAATPPVASVEVPANPTSDVGLAGMPPVTPEVATDTLTPEQVKDMDRPTLQAKLKALGKPVGGKTPDLRKALVAALTASA